MWNIVTLMRTECKWNIKKVNAMNHAMTICVAVPPARNMITEVKMSLRAISTSSQYLCSVEIVSMMMAAPVASIYVKMQMIDDFAAKEAA